MSELVLQSWFDERNVSHLVDVWDVQSMSARTMCGLSCADRLWTHHAVMAITCRDCQAEITARFLRLSVHR